jgi:hypothetical protein
VILDDLSHFTRVFPLKQKSDTCDTLLRFFSFVNTQFHTTIRFLQYDNGGKFLTNVLRTFLSTNGISLRLSYPNTSSQNGRAERMIRTTNDVVRTLLFQAKLQPPFCVEALHTSNHILNICPSRAIGNFTPYFLLYGVHPTYDHIRTFGYRCFPNLSHSIDHKLSPCSTRCVLLGYPWEQQRILVL